MILLFGTWFLLMLLGVPIAFTLGISSLLYLWVNDLNLFVIASKMFATVDSFVIIAAPLYILAGQLMNSGGMTTRIFRFAECVVGKFPGGLGQVNVLASMIFAGMSGSATADIGGLGLVELKAMEEAGYDKHFRTAITAASSTIGPILPPSIPFVFYSLLSGVSLGALFIAGFLPGVLMGIFLMIGIFLMARKKTFPIIPKKSFREFLKITWAATLSLITPGIILGGIIFGIFTPTEAAVIAVFYSLFIGMFVYRELNLKKAKEAMINTIEITGKIMVIVSLAGLFAWILAIEQIPQKLAGDVLQLSTNPIIILILINIFLLIVGCFIEPMAAQIILVPFLLPIVIRIGVDPVHFGVIMVLNLMIGILTPPFGAGLFMINSISDMPIEEISKAVFPFVLWLLLALLVITFVPEVCLYLPRLLFDY